MHNLPSSIKDRVISRGFHFYKLSHHFASSVSSFGLWQGHNNLQMHVALYPPLVIWSSLNCAYREDSPSRLTSLEETLGPWLPNDRPLKTLNRLVKMRILSLWWAHKPPCTLDTRLRGYIFFMVHSSEHEFSTANKSYNTDKWRRFLL